MNVKIRNIIVSTGMLLMSLPVWAGSAGHVDLKDLSSHYGEPKVEINLGASLIGMVSALSQKQDPETADLLSKLEMVKVRVYNIAQQGPDSAFKTVDSITSELRKDNWHPIVSVNEVNEKVRIFTKITNDIVDGLVVMAVDGNSGEAVFINIVGEIDPAQVSKVTQSLNMDLGLGSDTDSEEK